MKYEPVNGKLQAISVSPQRSRRKIYFGTKKQPPNYFSLYN